MRLSVWPGPLGGVAATHAVVDHCDRGPWHAAYVMDHFMADRPDGEVDDSPVPEALALVASLLARTRRISVGPLVLGATYRHPAVVAKAAATLDEISEGRLVLGLGAGWQLNEHRAYGIALGDVATRMERFEESTAIIASLLRRARTTFSGRHFAVTDAPCEPTPPAGRPPILIGAKGPLRGLRTAARHADVWNSWATVPQLRERLAVLARHCDEVGRDRDSIAVSTQAFVHVVDSPAEADRIRATPSERPRIVGSPAQVLDAVGAYVEAGLDELIVADWAPVPTSERVERLDRVADAVGALVDPPTGPGRP